MKMYKILGNTTRGKKKDLVMIVNAYSGDEAFKIAVNNINVLLHKINVTGFQDIGKDDIGKKYLDLESMEMIYINEENLIG